MCVRLCFAILMIAQSAWADEPGSAVQAVAKLSGPSNISPGEHAIISAKGTIGKDPQFDCFPPNKNWTSARAIKNEDMHISFATMEQGTYTFVLAVNSSSQTALTHFTITVGPPLPKSFADQLKDAYSLEISTENRLKLIAFTKEMTDQVDSFKGNFNDFDILLKTSSKNYLGDPTSPTAVLRGTRKVIGDYLLLCFGKPSTQPLDKNLAKKTLSDITNVLTGLNP